jgi:hypothetical protein
MGASHLASETFSAKRYPRNKEEQETIMSVLTRVRTAEERVLRMRPLEHAPATAHPVSSWPLPATQLPGAHLTWAEWVDLQASQLAREPHSENPSRLEVSAAPR